MSGLDLGPPDPKLRAKRQREAGKLANYRARRLATQALEDKRAGEITGIGAIDVPLAGAAAVGKGIGDTLLQGAAGVSDLVSRTMHGSYSAAAAEGRPKPKDFMYRGLFGGGQQPTSLGQGMQQQFSEFVAGQPPMQSPLPRSVSEIDPTLDRRLEANLGKFGKTALHAVGGLVPYFAGSGAAGALGKTVGTPGVAIQGLGAPGAAFGSWLVKNVPQAGLWGKVAQHLPGTLGSATGFGLYEYVAQEGGLEERAAAAGHGMAMGAVIHGLGTLGRAIENSMLGRGFTATETKAMNAVSKGLAEGKVEPGLLRQIPAKIAAAAVEGTGFVALDKNWWGDMWSGDPERQAHAIGQWMGSAAGILAAKSGDPNGYLFFRRTNPELNTTALREEAAAVRRGEQGPKSEEPGLLDPLFQSGWEGGISGGALEVSFPASEPIRRVRGDPELPSSTSIEVPASVYRAVRGVEGEGNVRLEGPAAEEFVRDLAAISLTRRIEGEIAFGAMGRREVGAGMDWSGQDGRHYAVGLDGNVYSRSVPHEPGEAWRNEGKPQMPTQDGSAALDPQIQRWAALIETLDATTAPTQGKELLRAAILAAVRGNPESPSIRELHDLLVTPMGQAPNADLLLQAGMTPQNIDRVGAAIAKVAAGHGTAQSARAELVQALAKQPEAEGEAARSETAEVALQAEAPRPEAEVIAAPDKVANLSQIAGEKDWRTVPRKEAKAAAERYADAALEAGMELTARRLEETFGLPRTSGRRVLEAAEAKSREFEKGGIELPTREEFAAAKGRISRSARKIVQALPSFATSMQRRVRKSGPVGADISRRARRASDETSVLLGEFGKTIEGALKETAYSPKGQTEAQKYATTPVYEGPYGDTGFKRAAEGKAPDAPADVKRWVEVARELRVQTGEAAKAAGVMQRRRVRNEKGEEVERMVPFEPVPREVNMLVRQMHPEFHELVKEGGADYLEAIELIAKHPENKLDPKVLEADFATQRENLHRKQAVEFQRHLKYLPSHLKLKSGREVTVLEAEPHDYLRQMRHHMAVRVAFAKHVGQDLPAEVRKEGMQPGPQKLLEELHREGGNVNEAKALFKSLQDLSPDSLDLRVPRPLRRAETLRRTALVMRSVLQDIPENLATLPQFAGFRGAFKGLWKLARDRKSVEKVLEDQFALSAEISHQNLTNEGGFLGWLTSKVGWLKQSVQDKQAVWAGATALKMAERWKRGEPTKLDGRALERLDFEPQEIALLLSGKGGALEQTFVRRMVKNATGQFLRGERSRLGASDVFNTAFPFNRYFMNRIDQMQRVTGALGTAIRSGDKAARRAAGADALRFAVGALAAGTIGNAFSIFLANITNPARAWDEFYSELTAHPFRFLTRSAISSFTGGLPMAAYRWAFEGSDVRHVLPWPLPVAMELRDAAVGNGPYRGENLGERALTLVGRQVPLSRDLDFVYAMTGLTYDAPEIDGAIRSAYDWARKYDVKRGGFSSDAPEDPTWFRAMQDVQGAIKVALENGVADVRKDPQVVAALRKALDVRAGDTIAQSLIGKRFLTDLKAEEINDLVDTRGERVYRALVRHDEALTKVAAAFRRVPMNVEAIRDFDTQKIVDVARDSARRDNPKGFKEAITALEDVMDSRRAAGLPAGNEFRDLAAIMAEHPKLARDSFSETDRKKIDRAQPHYRARVIERLLKGKLTGGAKPQTLEKALEAAR